MASKQEILEHIDHIARNMCERKNPCARRKDSRTPCPGARSVQKTIKDSSSLEEMQRELKLLPCAQSMFGHLLGE